MYFAEFETSSHIHEKFDTLTRFLLPFFFIYGGFAGCKICRMNNADSNFVASCIIARGDIAIIVATLAHTMGLFDTDMYAAVIIMAVTTQIIAPVVINKMYRKTKLCADTEKKEEAEAVSE
mgnify:CR=1 FL=1